MNWPAFLDLPPVRAEEADVLLLPLPYEASVSYGKGTSQAPAAIWRASTEVELRDEQSGFDLQTVKWHSAPPVVPKENESAENYLSRVEQATASLNKNRGLAVGIGGEHSLTPVLVRAAHVGGDDLSGVTVVQFDAHADLRDTYAGSPFSHACAMRRVVELSADVLAIGVRSSCKEEADFAERNPHVKTFPARRLSQYLLPGDKNLEQELLETLKNIRGDVYLTIDVDVLEVHLCPATGTPQPGGLGWWQTLRYLHALLAENQKCRLIGFDLVETVPQESSQVNEFTAAILLAKIVAFYHKSRFDSA